MFDYPIPPLKAGLYADLGLSPDALSEEINEAKQELATSIRQQQRSVQRDLDAIYKDIPELRETYGQMKSMQGVEGFAGSDDYWKLQEKLSRLEELAIQKRKDFKSLREKFDQFEKQLHEVNLIAIQSPEDRLQYDRAHPPFELIKLANCGASPLDERKTVLTMLREELSDFLEQAGETVFHPSDFTRQDFIQDYTLDPTLDRKV